MFATSTTNRARSGFRRVAAAAAIAAVLVATGIAPASATPVQDPPSTTAGRAPSASESAPTTTTPADGDGCDQLVHDPDGALVEGAEVTAAARRLVDQGTDLHVRVVARMLDGDDVRQLEERCGWRVEGSPRGEGAAVLVVEPGTDRVGLWYGDGLRRVVGARVADLTRPAPNTVGVAGLVDELGALIAAGPIDDPLGCDQLVFDPDGELVASGDAGAAAEVEDAAMALQAEGIDLRVRVEPPTDDDIDARLVQLEATCPGWTVDGDRPADRVIVMVQTSARSTGLWYGKDVAGSLASRWQSIQSETMDPRFRRGDVVGGLALGLEQLDPSVRTPFGSGPQGFTTPTSDASGSSGGSSVPIGPFLLLGLVIVGGWGFSYLSWKAKVESGETTESFSSYAGSRSGSRRRRSWSSGGSRSSGSRRSGGGGGRRSSGGGRRSGGGSSRW